MKTFLLHLSFMFFMLHLTGCMNSYASLSSRTPTNVDKLGSGPYYYHGRDITEAAPAPEIYVKKKDINITPIEDKNETGSLFNPNDQRNLLITSPDPSTIGRLVTIQVASVRMPEKKLVTKKENASKTGTSDDTATADKKGDGAKTKDKEDIDDTLMKSFPNLEPANADPILIKRFKMKIAKRYDNGDVELLYNRKSIHNQEGRELSISSRVPYEKLLANETITTNDLTEIRWMETGNGDIVESASPLWEDEYTFRLSGFTEEKSKQAVAIEDQRKQLLDIQKSLETRLKTFGQERREMTKQREELLAEQKKNQEKVAELEKTVNDQKSQIESLDPTAADDSNKKDAKKDEKKDIKGKSNGKA